MEASADSVATRQSRDELVGHYDALIYSEKFRDFCGHSEFANFGYWDARTRTHKEACENLMERLLAMIARKEGTILDVACGKGATTRHLWKHYRPGQVTGINVSAQQLTTSQAGAPGSHFAVMDAIQLGFDDNVFDNVICVEAAFHFNTRADFLREAFRVLKPGGYLALSDILMTLKAERRRKFRYERNFLADPRAYEAVLAKTGFTDTVVIDATEPCWAAFYRHVVREMHEKFLAREIDRETLGQLLEVTYGRVPDMKYYLLVAGRKPEA